MGSAILDSIGIYSRAACMRASHRVYSQLQQQQLRDKRTVVLDNRRKRKTVVVGLQHSSENQINEKQQEYRQSTSGLRLSQYVIMHVRIAVRIRKMIEYLFDHITIFNQNRSYQQKTLTASRPYNMERPRACTIAAWLDPLLLMTE